nr:pathogenesis-related genes transcriptional activator PTI6-like [Ipomoea trifida]
MDGNGNGNPVKYRVEKTVTLKQFNGGLCHNMPKVVRISVIDDDATNSSSDEGEFRGSFRRIMKKHVSEVRVEKGFHPLQDKVEKTVTLKQFKGGLCHNMPKVVRISVTDDDATDSSGDEGEFRGGFRWIMKKHISEVRFERGGLSPLGINRAPWGLSQAPWALTNPPGPRSSPPRLGLGLSPRPSSHGPKHGPPVEHRAPPQGPCPLFRVGALRSDL